MKQTLSRWRCLCYALIAIPLAGLSLPVYVYLPDFYANHLGLGYATVGAVLLWARLFDVIADPLVGILSDRLPDRFGRRKPFILLGLPLTMLAAWRLLLPPETVSTSYLLGWSITLYMAWTLMILPHAAWGAELSTSYHGRGRIAAWREGLTVVGTLLTLILGALANQSGQNPAESLAAIGLFCLILLPPLTLLLLTQLSEPQHPPAQRLPFRVGLNILWGNKPFLRLLSAYILNGFANGLPATLFIPFVSHRLGNPEAAGKLLALYFLCGILSVPLWLKLSHHLNKHRAWCIAMLLTCLCFAPALLLGTGDILPFTVICILSGFTLGADLILPPAMQADVIDIDTVTAKRPRSGLYFALWGMATKLALALAVGIAFPLLTASGFAPEENTITPAGLQTLSLLYAGFPILCKLLAISLMWGYPLDALALSNLKTILNRKEENHVA